MFVTCPVEEVERRPPPSSSPRGFMPPVASCRKLFLCLAECGIKRHPECSLALKDLAEWQWPSAQTHHQFTIHCMHAGTAHMHYAHFNICVFIYCSSGICLTMYQAFYSAPLCNFIFYFLNVSPALEQHIHSILGVSHLLWQGAVTSGGLCTRSVHTEI